MRGWKMALLVTTCMFATRAMSEQLAADEFERAPIEYSRSVPDNPVSRLQTRLDEGGLSLEHQDDLGYLPALLAALDVPIESQMLVFSKTSLQRNRISPRRPRAIYFNDEVYVGYCRSGDVLEVSAADPSLGTVFYTVDQRDTAAVRFARQTDNCLICHSSSRTGGVPGHLVRSLFVNSSGEPILSEGSFTVDHTTPFEQRWGGWYVTGTHGSQQHLGNLVIRDRNVTRPIDNTQGQNVTRLDDRLAVDHYLSPHSDLVALMVLEHQVLVHNRLAKASFAARQALHYEAELNRAMGESAENRLESTTRRMESAGDDLLAALLFVDEAPITAPIAGTSTFAEQFARIGPRDGHGRSLRDFDLQRRLFRHPCSYLIYSPSFQQLPGEMRDYVWRRMGEILTGRDRSERFAHLSDLDRRAIAEILRDTLPELPVWAR
jgi:hypothetical protein